MKLRNLFIIPLFIFTFILNAYAAVPDYKGLVSRIEVYLNDAVSLYQQGYPDLAKAKVQDAYFKVFENLEGPIRINVSARKNYQLEAEFGSIRKQIIAGKPHGAVEERVRWLITELHNILPELEGGVVLVAEGTHGDIPKTAIISKPINPTWQQALDNIRSLLHQALESYRTGDRQQSRRFITRAQFEGYKNTMLETAVRRHIAHAKDASNNTSFSSLLTLVKEERGLESMQIAVNNLLKSLQSDLPGLPLVAGADEVESAEDKKPLRNWAKVSAQLLSELQAAMDNYQSGQTEAAASKIQDIYFDTFEASGMEAAIAARNANLKAELESHFARIVGQMKNNAPIKDVSATLETMRSGLDEALELLGSGGESLWALFLYSLLIILREGFEAILVITALVAYLVKTGNDNKLKVIYNSVWVALGLSLVTAVLIEWVFDTSAASQEILEGVTMLIASLVLFSVSYWLISKAEAQKWMAYIKDKVEGSLTKRSLMGLWFASFLAVYREGAETVLFYKALTGGVDSLGKMAILAGFLIGCAALIVIYSIMRRGVVRLPLRPFFLITGMLLYFMAFVFIGRGVMELIAGKMFQPSLIEWMPQWSIVGIYPYWQSVIPQLLLVLAAIIAVIMIQRKTEPVANSKETV